MPVIEGAAHRTGGVGHSATVIGYGPYLNAGVPASGFLNGVNQKGGLVIDTTNGKLYINTGTLASTVYTVVGAQT